MSRPTTLAAWLAYLETLHPRRSPWGSSASRAVHARMGIALACPVVTVAGTNGKGSTCAMLEAMLRAAGYRIGPLHVAAPRALQRARAHRRPSRRPTPRSSPRSTRSRTRAPRRRRGRPTPLTYFEFGTLAALWLFARARLDVAILEVGLGGRLDAVNVVDADVAVVTSVDLDHMDYLGPTREDIGAREGRHLPRRAPGGLRRAAIRRRRWSRTPRRSARRSR